MIVLPNRTPIWIANGIADMHCGFDGLASIIQKKLLTYPFAGDLFVFRGRAGDLIRLLAGDGLLIEVLDRDEAHIGLGDGFTNGVGIGGFALAELAAHPVRRYELPYHQLEGVAEAAKFCCQIVGTGAAFHGDQARRQLSEHFEQLAAHHFGLDETQPC